MRKYNRCIIMHCLKDIKTTVAVQLQCFEELKESVTHTSHVPQRLIIYVNNNLSLILRKPGLFSCT